MSRVGRVGKRSDPSNDGERKASPVAPVLIGHAQFCGSPQTLLSQMKALHDLDVDVVDLAFPTGLMSQAQVQRSLELLAKEVLPRIHDFRKGALFSKRQVKGPACTKTERVLLVLLARAVRAWKQTHFIVQLETLLLALG